jgi:hypothetical protein
MSKYSQDEFIPKHPEKVMGKKQIFYRSSWELLMMNFLDNHPSVIQWSSESIRIPYTNPLTGQRTQYIPDFFILSQDKHGKRQAEMIEVKPKREALMEHARSQRDKAFLAINTAKFAAAMIWAKKNGVRFSVITEDQLFVQSGNKLKNKR